MIAESWWKFLWNLPLTSKIKIFGWKCFHDHYLPTGVNLKARHVTCNPICKSCRESKESSLLALVFCDSIAEVWDRSIFVMAKRNFRGFSGKDFLLFMKIHITKDEFAVLLTLMCSIWYERNKFIYGG